MKRAAFLFLMLAGMVIAQDGPPMPWASKTSVKVAPRVVLPPPSNYGRVLLTWEWPEDVVAKDLSFNLYQVDNINPPTWTFLTNISTTNSIILDVTETASFFRLQASNSFWGGNILLDTNLTIQWDCFTNDLTPEASFNIYEVASLENGAEFHCLTNISVTNFLPFTGTNWSTFATAPWPTIQIPTNYFVATNFQINIGQLLKPARHFLYVTISNANGESMLSDPGYTPPAATIINTLKIERLP